MMLNPYLRAAVRAKFSTLLSCAPCMLAGYSIAASIAPLHAATEPIDSVNAYIGSGSGSVGYGGMMPFCRRAIWYDQLDTADASE